MTVAEPLSVIGLGKLGLGFAACLARGGFDVLGIDLDPDIVARVNGKATDFDEPDVASCIAEATGTLRATSDIAAAVTHGDAVFLLLPTPSLSDGSFDSSAIARAVTDICQVVRAQAKSRFLIVIGSTISPGTITNTVIPIVEAILNEPIGKTISVCYNPEFVALGQVVADFERPDFILIGESDAAAGAEVERILRSVACNNPPVHRMPFVSAEIAKLALNGFLTVKISFANFLSQICSRIDGADVDAITGMLGDDSRVGRKYLRAGPPFGGPCFPRDVGAFAAVAAQYGEPAGLLEQIREINSAQRSLLVEVVCREVERVSARSAAILGLAYNDASAYVIESPSLALIQSLYARGITVFAHDARAMKSARQVAGERFTPALTADECVQSAPVIVLANRDASYIDAIVRCRSGGEKVVVDCWRALDPRAVGGNVRIVKFGFSA